jgi:hypothetical protein
MARSHVTTNHRLLLGVCGDVEQERNVVATRVSRSEEAAGASAWSRSLFQSIRDGDHVLTESTTPG